MSILPKSFIAVDTETTGVYEGDNVIEIAAVAVKNGIVTGSQFHAYLRPRKKMELSARSRHKLGNNFYSECCAGVYGENKKVMLNFLDFAGTEPIYAHNAEFDLKMINRELSYWNCKKMDASQFNCSQELFYKVVSSVYPELKRFLTVEECAKFFNLKFVSSSFHTALFDAFVVARVLLVLQDFALNEKSLFRSLKNVEAFTEQEEDEEIIDYLMSQSDSNVLGSKRI